VRGGLAAVLPAELDDAALDDPVAAPAPPAARAAGIPDAVRHAEKWRLALEMIDEMTGPGGWGVLDQVTAAGGTRPVVVADAAMATTPLPGELAARGWRYAVAVKAPSAPTRATRPEAMAYGGMGRPASPLRTARPACASSRSRTQTRSSR